MTVKDYIKKLQKLDQKLEVIIFNGVEVQRARGVSVERHVEVLEDTFEYEDDNDKGKLYCVLG